MQQYNAQGKVIRSTDLAGRVTTTGFDCCRKIHKGGATYPVSYGYDVFGNKVSMTTYRNEGGLEGDVTRWRYDAASNCMTNKVYADGNGTTYGYDAHGRLVKRTWARGIVTTYTYDAWGNLTRTDYSDSTPSVVLTYDAMGRQTRAVDAAGTTTFVYDAFGSLTNETVVSNWGSGILSAPSIVTNTIDRYYDAFGRDAGYALNGVRQSTLAYDTATGRLSGMRLGDASSNWGSGILSAPEFTWSYLPGSDLKSSLVYPNGLTASWTYGNRGELLEVNNALADGSISKYAYTYDAAGRRIGCAKSGSAFEQSDSVNYGYNARSELTSATAAVDSDYRYGYNFDDIGNRKTSSERGTNSVYTASQLNQYTAVDDFTPVYDADGNETLVKTATGIWQVSYNGENRPVRWTKGNTVITMSYDRMGRRVTKNNQRFVYDGYLQIAEFTTAIPNSLFLLRNSYVWDPTEKIATRPLAWNSSTSQHSTSQPSTSQLLFYTHDGNKNVSEVIAANGAVAAHYEYAPFGALTAQRGTSASSNPWRFSSECAEDDTATVYYNYRHYEPVAGRWMQRDPINEVGGINLYCLVMNRPVSYSDKNGRSVSESECDEVVKKAKEYYMSRILLSAINSDERCSLPTIKCGCCDQGGYFDPSTKTVVICANNLSAPNYAVAVLYHELTHAYDDCKGTRWNSCEQRACSEIRARKISGECKPGGNKNSGRMIGGLMNFEEESNCIKKSAAESLKLAGCIPASDYIDPVYERCANDLSPFDKDSL